MTKPQTTCSRCRTRKVKCCGTRPSCTCCVKRGFNCEYKTDKVDGPQALVFLPPSTNQPPNQLSLTEESTKRRILELRLMHHFTSCTAWQEFLAFDDGGLSGIWQVHTPVLAFEHQFLLSAMISIAALHISKIGPYQQDMVVTHGMYHNAAKSQHRHAEKDLRAHNAEAVLLSTMLIALPAFISLQDTDVNSYSPPLHFFYMLAGNSPIFEQGPLLVSPSSEVRCILTAKSETAQFLTADILDIYLEQFSPLLNWRAPDELVDLEGETAYKAALRFIGRALSFIEGGITNSSYIRRIIYLFPTIITSVFIDRLRDKNPRALVILSYYFCLLKAVENVWWMRGIADKEVYGIETMLPQEWKWAMCWPLQKLSLFEAHPVPPM